jgi:deoxyribodipyrimidine photo-lyase
MTIKAPEAGGKIGFARLNAFKRLIEGYGERRDLPAVDGTSQLSIFFKNGTISPAQAIAFLDLQKLDVKGQSGATKFLKEIVWREFYYHILHHVPRVEKEAFLLRYKNIKWENDETRFERWCAGETGYPIIDAGMRQLNTTGWMHNRVRMVVASFLVKDLLIDWRWGENYFMKKLLDGDLAPNNGGWQWAASTGCDPQPYFRIFNPWLQSAKFDPDGEYIRRFVPELAQSSPAAIHDPDASDRPSKYIRPIVIHAEQKSKALALYKGAE